MTANQKLERYMQMKAAGADPLVDVEVCAALLSVSVRFLREHSRKGKIRAHHLGRKVLRFRPDEVIADLERVRRPGRPRGK